MRYARITITVAVENYGVDHFEPLDHVIPPLHTALDDHPDVILLDYVSEPMKLVFGEQP
ncbi:MAG: hypothetical protein GY871_09600 [Actinomycetales bacterium]|nr:hypothetical protein [Actinomycetales bacterium]